MSEICRQLRDYLWFLVLFCAYIWYKWIFTKGRIQSIRWWLSTPIIAINNCKLLWVLTHKASWTAALDVDTSCSYCRFYRGSVTVCHTLAKKQQWNVGGHGTDTTSLHTCFTARIYVLRSKLLSGTFLWVTCFGECAKIRCAKCATSLTFWPLFAGGLFPSGQGDRSVKLTSYLPRIRKFFFVQCHYMSFVDLVVLPPGHGDSVTDFWGWDAHEARLRCPDDVWVVIEDVVPGGALNLNSTNLPRPWSLRESSPSRKIPTVEPGIEPGTSWLVVRNSDR